MRALLTDAHGMAARDWRGDGSTLPPAAVKELLALQSYLTAMESFNDWFSHYHRGQPTKPQLAANPSFTERVAHEQREKQFLAEMERWRSGQLIQSKQAEEKLRAVLTFPGGWLVEVGFVRSLFYPKPKQMFYPF